MIKLITYISLIKIHNKIEIEDKKYSFFHNNR